MVEIKQFLVTLWMTFSERELIPSYNRLWDRYGKLLHCYLSCLGDHQSTGAGGDAIKKGVRVYVCACVSKNVFLSQVSLINCALQACVLFCHVWPAELFPMSKNLSSRLKTQGVSRSQADQSNGTGRAFTTTRNKTTTVFYDRLFCGGENKSDKTNLC